jgi:G3E family GTPase
VIETTGIAEPRAIRQNFQLAEDYAMPLLDEVRD